MGMRRECGEIRRPSGNEEGNLVNVEGIKGNKN